MTSTTSPLCLPVTAWPAADRQAWEAAVTPGDFLEPGGPLSHLAPRTLKGVAQSYGRWLAWVAAGEAAPPVDAPPAARVTPERVTAYIQDLRQHNAPYTVRNRVRDLLVALRGLAPDGGWGFLERAHAHLHARARPAGDKRPRLQASSELFALGLRLMSEAEAAEGLSPVKRAAGFRDGLLVALLAARPLRLRNAAGLTPGRSLVATDGGWMIRIAAEEVKTRRPLEMAMPEALVPWLERYLDHHRPALLGNVNGRTRTAHDGLWVSQFGTRITDNALYKIVCRLTEAAFGRSVNPHLFRDSAATTIAIEDPAHVRMAARLLGHASSATTERYYNQAQAVDAARAFQAGVLDPVRRGRPASPRACRPAKG